MQFNKSIQLRFLFIYLCLTVTAKTELYAQKLTAIKSEEGIEILENDKKVLFFQVRPKSVNGKYERAGFVHPLYGLNENILTEDMPADHPYHRGIFWAWHQIILNGKNIADGWVSENISWKPTKVTVRKRKESIILQSQMLWNAGLDQNKETAIIKEKTRITAFKSNPQYRILDFEIDLYPLTGGLKIGGSDDAKGYGGFSLRLKLPGDLSFVSNNKTVIPTETAVLAGPWMNITGSFEGESMPKSGLIVFGYPSGSGNQYPWILRKVTSMQNIPFPGRTPIELPSGGLKLSYRVIVHNGEMNNEDIEKLYQQYIHKP